MWVGIVTLVILIGVWRFTYRAMEAKHPGKLNAPLWGHGVGIPAGVICSIIFILIAVEGLGLGSTEKAVPATTEAKHHEPSVSDYQDVSAAELFSAYDGNEVAADERFKGKLLGVQGKIQSIDKDAFQHIVIRLATKNQFMPISATINPVDKGTAALLSKGETTRLYCEGAGRVIGSPVLKECFIDHPK